MALAWMHSGSRRRSVGRIRRSLIAARPAHARVFWDGGASTLTLQKQTVSTEPAALALLLGSGAGMIVRGRRHVKSDCSDRCRPS